MCGIAGIFHRGGPALNDSAGIQKMCATLTHRGPDDFGYLLLNSHTQESLVGQRPRAEMPCDLQLAHRRLSITDLSLRGRQPMESDDGRFFLVFNGAVFNYLELRELLKQKGYVFHSQTDSEVVMNAYAEWGGECVQHFNGMWAFAVWDQRKRRLFCSRDRFGIKPFYYHLTRRMFVFASEIKALIAFFDHRPECNAPILHDYLVRGRVCHRPETFFRDIRQLKAAHNMEISSATVREWKYWDYGGCSRDYDTEKPEDTLRSLLEDAVRLRLRGDVPVGIALSGGLDSTSLLASLPERDSSEPVHAFTVGFPGFDFDETVHATVAARRFGVTLHQIHYQPEDLFGDLCDVLWHLDYPATVAQVLPRWKLMRAASQHIKVILEGQGGDELVGGYIQKNLAPYVMDELSEFRLAAWWRALVAMARVTRSSGPLAILGLGSYLIPQSVSWSHRIGPLWRVLTPSFRESFPDRREKSPPVGRFGDRLSGTLYLEHAIQILPMLLKFGDALSMAASVESRLPFLDYRLVEFSFQLSYRHKMDAGVTKPLLRKAFQQKIPGSILNRRDKVGFRTPIHRWLESHMEDTVRPLLLSRRCRRRNIFDNAALERLLAESPGNSRRLSSAIFKALSVEVWFRMFIDNDIVASPSKRTF